MKTSRLEAFSDGVLAIIITIMVLELRVPHGTEWADLSPLLPVFLTYILSFINLGIYWNNHHHLMTVTERINGRILWANLHLLFWLSLIPATTGWMGENDFAELPTMLYGVNLVLAAIAYYILQSGIIREQGRDSAIATAIGNDIKGKLSPVLYLAGISVALLNRWVALGFYVAVALMWLIPDRRLESVVIERAAER